ncbi:MAG: hypothetical protein DRP02_01895 [Candidatus Gerdarchaeota archaeon]|nr:MAG: hypothetical protein DRP02_01895 [Candidatus Gerdarchaeota archaeon]
MVIFRCKNKQCKHIFTPSTILIVEEQKLFFECPLCGSRYEANYIQIADKLDHEIIMLREWPRLIHLGTRIASS